jgi:hypothetical protein
VLLPRLLRHLHTYCYMPLYVFCSRHPLATKLRPANIDACAGSVEEVGRIVAQIWRRWPRVRIMLRADAGFTREALWSGASTMASISCLAWPRTIAPPRDGKPHQEMLWGERRGQGIIVAGNRVPHAAAK